MQESKRLSYGVDLRGAKDQIEVCFDKWLALLSVHIHLHLHLHLRTVRRPLSAFGSPFRCVQSNKDGSADFVTARTESFSVALTTEGNE